jgi:hypothetical protein
MAAPSDGLLRAIWPFLRRKGLRSGSEMVRRYSDLRKAFPAIPSRHLRARRPQPVAGSAPSDVATRITLIIVVAFNSGEAGIDEPQNFPMKCPHCPTAFHDNHERLNLQEDGTSHFVDFKRLCPTYNRFVIGRSWVRIPSLALLDK